MLYMKQSTRCVLWKWCKKNLSRSRACMSKGAKRRDRAENDKSTFLALERLDGVQVRILKLITHFSQRSSPCKDIKAKVDTARPATPGATSSNCPGCRGWNLPRKTVGACPVGSSTRATVMFELRVGTTLVQSRRSWAPTKQVCVT